MRTVLLRLEGPLQSWGTQGRFGIRDTDREPSKSGIIGLVGAALGMPRDDHATLNALRALTLAVRVDREGELVRDYHTAGGGTFRGETHQVWSPGGGKLTAVTERFYVADASYLCALGGDDAPLVDRIAHALERPVWPLSLGRRACPPSQPVFAGVVDVPPAEAIRRAPLDTDRRQRASSRVRIVLEVTRDTDGARLRQDDPESFALYGRRHGARYVRYDYVDRDALPEVSS